jgi:hypothetical protein
MGVHHQQSVVLRNKTRIAPSVSDRPANHACRAREVGGDTDCLSRKSFPLAATRPTLACDWSGGDVRAVGMGHDDASAERSSPVGRLGGSVSRRLFSFNGCADVIAHARARGRGEKVVGRNHEGSWTGGDIPRADTSHFPASRVPDYAAQMSPSLLALNAVLSSVCACPGTPGVLQRSSELSQTPLGYAAGVQCARATPLRGDGDGARFAAVAICKRAHPAQVVVRRRLLLLLLHIMLDCMNESGGEQSRRRAIVLWRLLRLLRHAGSAVFGRAQGKQEQRIAQYFADAAWRRTCAGGDWIVECP